MSFHVPSFFLGPTSSAVLEVSDNSLSTFFNWLRFQSQLSVPMLLGTADIVSVLDSVTLAPVSGVPQQHQYTLYHSRKHSWMFAVSHSDASVLEGPLEM
jgi:hypothetical protein